tara:strand:+ start:75 stop:536 length:462 start_codon:yes stop_codon:yes gene_type:complete
MDKNEAIDVAALRDQFLGKVFDEYVFTLDAEKLVQYAKSCGETSSKYTDPNDPDFQAPPTIASSFNPRQDYPDNFPSFEGLGMDAGKSVELERPMRAGEEITATTALHDIYTKSGRSGRMVFFVNRMTMKNPKGDILGSSDTSVVIREKPQDS